MALRNDLFKVLIILAVLFVITKYPEQFGNFIFTAIMGLSEVLISKFVNNIHLMG